MAGSTEEARGGSGLRRLLGLPEVRRLVVVCAVLGVSVWALGLV